MSPIPGATARAWRLLETGPAPAAWHMALDAVLLERCGHGAVDPSPPTVRLLRFSPPAVLVGAFQSVETEVRLEHCQSHGIDVSRRVTGGGAIFFDESQIGWEIACRFEDLGGPSRPSEDLFRSLSEPVVAALRELGLPARYRPRNDIEVHGRKISGTGGTDLHGALLFQGTLLVDLDVETMVRALRVPVEKLSRREVEGMRDRVTWLSRELGAAPPASELRDLLLRCFERALGVELRPGDLTRAEAAALDAKLPLVRSDEWVVGRARTRGDCGKAVFPAEGGVVHAVVRTEDGGRRLRAVALDGDFFAFPRRAVLDLEAWLKGVTVAHLPGAVERFFHEHEVEIPGVGAAGVTAAILEAVERTSRTRLGMSPRQLNSVFPVGGSIESVTARRPTHLLLPYCAKPVDCEWRRLDGCDGCGECTVGAAVLAARREGLEARSITSFEHLMRTLDELAGLGAPAFLGSCCEAFYVKHRRELEAVGLPGLLVDVAAGETCYDLGKASFAERGEFEGESALDLDLLESVLRAWNGGEADAAAR